MSIEHDKLTAGDLRSVSYFWHQKGSLESLVDWEERVLPLLKRDHPIVARRLEAYKTAKSELGWAIDAAQEEEEDE